jgi:hypothetical protein
MLWIMAFHLLYNFIKNIQTQTLTIETCTTQHNAIDMEYPYFYNELNIRIIMMYHTKTRNNNSVPKHNATALIQCNSATSGIIRNIRRENEDKQQVTFVHNL